MAKSYLIAAAFSGMAAVILGAFGAHGLRAHLSPELMTIYQTGVQYHFYHTLGLLAVAVMLTQWPGSRALRWSGNLFLVGIVIFSGSLYLLSFTGLRWLGAITPIGGLAFIVAWLMMLLAVWKDDNGGGKRPS